MKVLSLFWGIETWYLALKSLWFHIDKYYSCENDKFARKVSMFHFPDIIELWDVKDLSWKESFLRGTDIVIGWPPCQDLSSAKRWWKWLEWPKSSLFYDFVKILNNVKPKYFLMENVASMKKKDRDTISWILWCEPIEINSALVSGQWRKRLYWTNIPLWVVQDKKILLKDIISDNVPDKYLLSEKELSYMNNEKFKYVRWRMVSDVADDKSKTVIANYRKGVPYNVLRLSDWTLRKFTPEECEALQTFPIWFTSMLSNSQRYKVIWNAWTLDVIKFLFNKLPYEKI